MLELVRFLVDRLPSPAATDWRETVIVTPSAFAAAAVRESVVRSGHDLLGVHFVTVPGLARLTLERCGLPAPRRRADPLEERALLSRVLESLDGGLADYARRFGAAKRQLATAIREWQQAGRPQPERAEAAREFVAIAAQFERATADFATRAHLVDTALAALTARPGETCRAPDFDLLFVAVPEHADATTLRDALAAAGCRVATWPGQPSSSAAGARVPTSLTSAPDPLAELRHAARGCVDLAARGVPWHQLAVAVPRLSSYARQAVHAFRAEGAPLCSAAESSLLGEPRAALHLHAARLLFGNAERSSYLALLGAPLARTALPPAELGCFDRLSRHEHFEGRGPHVATFTRALEAAGAPRIAARITSWHRYAVEVAERAHTTAARHDALHRWLAEVLRAPLASEPRDLVCAERLGDAYAAMQRAAAIYEITTDGAGFVRELEELLLERGMPLYGASESDAVRLVDYDDALAIPAHSMWICGLADGAVPQAASAYATTLGEAECRALDLPDAAAVRALELANLQRLCAHADVATHLVRARRDFEGRTVAASMWLAELAPAELRAAELRLPTHPLARTALGVDAGRAPRDLALTRVALLGANEATIRAIAGAQGASTWRIAQDLERFEPTTLARDGDLGRAVGAELATQSLSVSALRALGHCPLRYAFAHAIGLEHGKLPAEPDPFELPRDRLGTRIHSVLERLYADFAERLAAAPSCTSLAAAMAEHATWLLETELADDRGPLERDFPTLHVLHERRWRDALLEFLRFDLARCDEDGSRPERTEASVQTTLRAPRPNDVPADAATPAPTIELTLHGRPDRIDRLADGGVRLIDFKTGAAPKDETSPTEILKLRRPQLASYALALDDHGDRVGAAEICGIHPRGAADLDDEVRHSYAFDAVVELPHGEFGRRFVAALGIAASLRERAALLPTPDPNTCRYCDYKLACRRLHPPSRERVRQSEVAEFVQFERLGELAKSHRATRGKQTTGE